MQGKERTFTPEVEKVWNKDYQCEYYRGVIIDGEDNIVERCTRTHASYGAALDEAKKKMAYSPLYYRQAGADIKEKLEEYKKKKAIEEKKNAVVIFDTKEFSEWQYMYEPKDGGILYRFRYKNQMSEASAFLSAKSGSSAVIPLLANEVYRKGESDKIFYESRIRSEYDIEKLPGHKDIWKITSIVNVTQNKNQDSKVTVRYLKFGNLTKEFKKREREKTIVIKRKWAFYNDLMEYIHNYADIR